MSTRVLLRRLNQQYEIRWGRYLVRSVFGALGVVAYSAGLSVMCFTDHGAVFQIASQGLGLLLGLCLFWMGGPVSGALFNEVRISTSDLAQIERDEGWFDKGLAAMFYAKHGNPLPAELNSEVTMELSSLGHGFHRVAGALCEPDEEFGYPIEDVVLLVQGSSLLSALGAPALGLYPHLTPRAMIYIAASVLVASLPACIAVALLAAKVMGW